MIQEPATEVLRIGFLDTNVAQGTSIALLEELHRRGWRLRVSDIALMELVAHLPEDATRILPRLARLTPLLDPGERIAPTHMVLIDKLGGRLDGVRVEGQYDLWKRVRGATLDEPLLLEDLDPAALADIRALVAEREGDFSSTLMLARSIAEDGARDVSDLACEVAEASRLPVRIDGGADERMHLYNALIGLHGARAALFDWSKKRGKAPRFDPNSTHDTNVAQHLAEGGFVITDDRRYIVDDVDPSGSFQGPWVRTPWEILVSELPVGLPWGDGARRSFARHQRRTMAGLAAIEQVCRRDVLKA